MIQNNIQQWKIKNKISETVREAPHNFMQTLVPFNEEYTVFNSFCITGRTVSIYWTSVWTRPRSTLLSLWVSSVSSCPPTTPPGPVSPSNSSQVSIEIIGHPVKDPVSPSKSSQVNLYRSKVTRSKNYVRKHYNISGYISFKQFTG